MKHRTIYNLLALLTIFVILVPVSGDYFKEGDVMYTGTIQIEANDYSSILLNVSDTNRDMGVGAMIVDIGTNVSIHSLRMVLLYNETATPVDINDTSVYNYRTSYKGFVIDQPIPVINSTVYTPYYIIPSDDPNDSPDIIKLVFYNYNSTPVEYNLTITYTENITEYDTASATSHSISVSTVNVRYPAGSWLLFVPIIPVAIRRRIRK